MSKLSDLEELIGVINTKSAKIDLEHVLNRLILIGISPEESVLLVAKVYSALLDELYYPIKD